MPIDIKDQYFGTEIEMTCISRERAAKAVAELFGTAPSYDGGYYGVWQVKDREGKDWKFTYDGSIHTQVRRNGQYLSASDDYSTEMVSPKLTYSEMEKLQEVVRCLRRNGGRVNPSCGMHVHVDASNHTPRSIKNALTIMYSNRERKRQGWVQKGYLKLSKLPYLQQDPCGRRFVQEEQALSFCL